MPFLDYYIPLHVHTEYSFLDGLAKISDLMTLAKERKLPALAITDHNPTGIVDFFFACRKKGIKAILGTELYLNDTPEIKTSENRKTYHIVMIAKNLQGYKDLIKIYSEAAQDGFYYRARTCLVWIRKHNTGNIIISTACMGGKVPSLLTQGRYDEAEKELKDYKDVFGEKNVYIELMPFDTKEQIELNYKLYYLAQQTNTEMIITSDSHYIEQKDAEVQKILAQIAESDEHGGRKTIVFDTDKCYVMTRAEIVRYMQVNNPKIALDDVNRALDNTVAIAEQCEEYEIGSDVLQVPEFDLPNGVTADDQLKKLCYEAFPGVYGNRDDAKERLDYELGVISKLNYSSYFLIVHDLIDNARKRGGVVGPGRGSAAGCVVSYLLGIVRLDPIRWGLHFERFLNPDRAKPPDIDIDFGGNCRADVIDYIQTKYGKDKVAQIMTINRLGTKSVLKDVARVMNINYKDVNEITKKIPFKFSLTQAVKEIPVVSEFKDKYPKLFEIASKIENLPRNSGKHPAGIVITPKPLNEYAAVAKDTKAKDGEGIPVLQLDMEAAGKMQLLKIDCLGLDSVDLIVDTCTEIKNNWGIDLSQADLDSLDVNDPAVYKMLRTAKTNKVFQLGSDGMKRLLKKLKPNKFEDLIALIALFRPGPMESIPDYSANKADPDHIKYLHPELKQILDETYGIMLYQEQIMEVVKHFSGIPFGQADLFRRNLEYTDNTDVKVMKEREDWKNRFIDGTVQKGYSKNIAIDLINWLSKQVGYNFNKSHSTAYAVNSFQMGWLKTYFPVEFMVNTLRMSKKEELQSHVDECVGANIPILPPDINKSQVQFSCENRDYIRTGLMNIKGVGEAAAKAIIENIGEVPSTKGYGDIIEFLYYNRKSMNVVKRILSALVNAGALDSIAMGNRKIADKYIGAFMQLEKDLKKMPDKVTYRSVFETYVRKNYKDLQDTQDYTYEEKFSQEMDCLGFKSRTDIIPKKRSKPNIKLYSSGNGAVKKEETVAVPPVISKGGKGMAKLLEGKHEAVIVDCKADEDNGDIYYISVKIVADGSETRIKWPKHRVVKYKHLIKKGTNVILNINRDENGKRHLIIEEPSGGEVTVENGVESQTNESEPNVTTEESPKPETPRVSTGDVTEERRFAAVMALMKHLKYVPMGVKYSLFDCFDSNGDIDAFCDNNLLNIYVGDNEHFRKIINILKGKCNWVDMLAAESELSKSEKAKKYFQPKSLDDQSIDLIDFKKKALKDLHNAVSVAYKDDSNTEQNIINVIKACVAVERELTKMYRRDKLVSE